MIFLFIRILKMAVNNYGAMHMPQIVRNLYGWNINRPTLKLPVEDSTALYVGQFVSMNDATNGKEFGITTYADDDYLFGFVTGFTRLDSNVPIQDDPQRQGTVTDATGEIPMKYTFSSTNDESNTTSADLELAEIMPIHNGDIIEVSLWGASTVSVARGTTTAAGTTTSSDNIGVSMSVDTTYPFALTESTAAKTQADLDMMTISLDGHKPGNSHRVYAVPTRTFSGMVAAAA